MQLRARRPHRPHEPVVPLVNVVFLLLVFFMLAGDLTAPPPLEVQPPRAPARPGPDPEERPTLHLGPLGTLGFEGERVSQAELDEALANRPPRRLALRADASTPARVLLPLIAKLEAAGVEDLDLVTTWGPPARRVEEAEGPGGADGS